MKTLLILRHAKSSHKDTDLDDFDRPLNQRGKQDAPRMGLLLKEDGLLPDLIVASSAKRTRKTADAVIASSGYRGEVRISGELYEASGEKLRAIVAALPESCSRALLIGHNPGLEALLESLTGEYTPLSTAALAKLILTIDSWSQAATGQTAQLVKVWQPRELE